MIYDIFQKNLEIHSKIFHDLKVDIWLEFNIQNGDKILCICIFILSQVSQDLVPFILLLSVSLSYFCTITFLPNFRFLCQGNHNRMTQDLHTYIKENTTLNLAFAPILDMVHWVKQNKKKMNPVVLENMLNKL